MLLAIMLLAPLGLTGCGSQRQTPSAGTGSGSSPQPTVSVGGPAVDQLLSAARPANLVICVLDAARADHIGCYGYPRDTTPNIDQLARESVVFRNHFAAFPSTRPSTLSLLTGLYPDAHLGAEGQTTAEAAFTFAKGLKAAGFDTAFFSSNAVASPETGVGADFDRVFVKQSARGKAKKERIPDDDLWRTPEGLIQVFARWLADEGQSRFFAYCHFLPPHNPYNAPDALKQLVAAEPAPTIRRRRLEFPEAAPPYGEYRPFALGQWANLYDANMRWADWGVGEVVRQLRERGLLNNTLLVVTADHGEAFGEHGYIYHAHAVYDEFVHIPLVIRFPGQQRLVGEVGALTQTVDLLPAIFDFCRIPYPRDRVQGDSLLPLLDGKASRVREYVFARSAEPWPSYLVRDSAWSLILYRGGKLRTLYDLRADPEQTRNAIAEHPDVAQKMVAAFRRFASTQKRSLDEFLSPQAVTAPAPKAPPSKLSEETRRELKALGYLE